MKNNRPLIVLCSKANFMPPELLTSLLGTYFLHCASNGHRWSVIILKVTNLFVERGHFRYPPYYT